MGEGAAVNVGDYLVQHSTLSSGTALAHLLALQTGGGTVFASMFAVRIDEPRLTLVQMPSVEARSDYTPPEVRQSGDDKALFVLTRTGATNVLTTLDELTIRQANEQSVTVRDFGNEQFTVRDVAVIEMEN